MVILERIKIPKNLWEAQVDLIPDHCSHKQKIQKYLENLKTHIQEGNGLLLHGNYSRGKSAIGAIILKEAAKYGHIGLWVNCKDIPEHCIKEYAFDEENTWKSRMLSVPLLLIDEVVFYGDKRDYYLDEIVRTRLAQKLCTCLTTNYSPDKIQADYPALFHALREVAVPQKIDGHDFRQKKSQDMNGDVFG